MEFIKKIPAIRWENGKYEKVEEETVEDEYHSQHDKGNGDLFVMPQYVVLTLVQHEINIQKPYVYEHQYRELNHSDCQHGQRPVDLTQIAASDDHVYHIGYGVNNRYDAQKRKELFSAARALPEPVCQKQKSQKQNNGGGIGVYRSFCKT